LELDQTTAENENRDEQEEVEPAKTAEKVIKKYGCIACHKVLDSPAEIGPALTKIGAIRSATQLRRSIIDPMAEITEGYQPLMPPTFKDQMTAGELELVVNFLEQSK
jgi:cytochrome c oxidase subunit 2